MEVAVLAAAFAAWALVRSVREAKRLDKPIRAGHRRVGIDVPRDHPQLAGANEDAETRVELAGLLVGPAEVEVLAGRAGDDDVLLEVNLVGVGDDLVACTGERGLLRVRR